MESYQLFLEREKDALYNRAEWACTDAEMVSLLEHYSNSIASELTHRVNIIKKFMEGKNDE